MGFSFPWTLTPATVPSLFPCKPLRVTDKLMSTAHLQVKAAVSCFAKFTDHTEALPVGVGSLWDEIPLTLVFTPDPVPPCGGKRERGRSVRPVQWVGKSSSLKTNFWVSQQGRPVRYFRKVVFFCNLRFPVDRVLSNAKFPCLTVPKAGYIKESLSLFRKQLTFTLTTQVIHVQGLA